ncbi:uncharacterized protein PGTG_05453 [Puccinia graminis f. sp. tritici CRL 75-36-700-3]|uniref:Cdc37 N-terminal domain-containing protein n=1 Tax=Puccinia graminis f. sp. tritici (strain CRL 75-36-700-3 / race SCCL) TaxID=418459 RepID=E3K4E6_PUCGT|nr:uncharacterized protein PGTG_05453 [Puccinia graminis f. sp. tritici CRL 75-36-700-3]EFP79132.1 hypothetical protein PGTG_05453 [Puccinia graminis f. sp. tritici CRL 75-36-700-3]
MPLNYAKWDSVELSNDSDLECPPAINKEKNAPPKHCQTHQQHECRKAEDKAFKWTGKLNGINIKQLQQLLTNIDKKGVIHLREASAKLLARGQGDSARTALFRYIDDTLHRIKDLRPANQHASAVEQLQYHLAELVDRERQHKIELEKQETVAHEQPPCGHAHEEFDVSQCPKSGAPFTAPTSQLNSTKKDKSTGKDEPNKKDGPTKKDGKSTAKSKLTETTDKEKSTEKVKTMKSVLLPGIKSAKKPQTKLNINPSPSKRPKPPSPINPSTSPESAATPSNRNCNEVKQRRVAPLPATKPDETGQYESSSCHQCRVKTTRPKMICDQSQNPSCVVRVCYTCLMRPVYNNIPELRPPLLEFKPGGKMLCVKCRGVCPCASCRRIRFENEKPQRGFGSSVKRFYVPIPTIDKSQPCNLSTTTVPRKSNRLMQSEPNPPSTTSVHRSNRPIQSTQSSSSIANLPELVDPLASQTLVCNTCPGETHDPLECILNIQQRCLMLSQESGLQLSTSTALEIKDDPTGAPAPQPLSNRQQRFRAHKAEKQRQKRLASNVTYAGQPYITAHVCRKADPTTPIRLFRKSFVAWTNNSRKNIAAVVKFHPFNTMEDSLKAQFQYLSQHLIQQSKFQNPNKINSAAYAGSMYSLGWRKAFEAETTIGVPGISEKVSFDRIGYEDLQTNVPIINEFIGKGFQLLSEPLYNEVKEHFQPLEAPGLAPHFFTDPDGFTCHLSYTFRHFANTPHEDDDASPYSFAMWLPIDQNSGDLIEEDLNDSKVWSNAHGRPTLSVI